MELGKLKVCWYYKTVLVPRLIGVVELKAADHKILQSAQLKFMRKILEVPRSTPTAELKAADHKILQSAQLKFMRKILEVPRSTPTAALYLELGHLAH